jgi:signal transduction histidine kinase
VGAVESERSRAEDRLQAVLEVARAVLEGRELDAVLLQVARSARELVAADLAVVATAHGDGPSYRIRVADGMHADRLPGARVEPGRSLLASVARNRRAMAVDDASTQPTADLRLAGLIDAGPALVVPLPARARGSLAVVRRRGRRPFPRSELGLLELFATQAATALDYLGVREELERLAVVSERERIGRELHDGAIQALFSVGISLQGTAVLLDDAVLQSRMDAAVTQLDTTIHDLRSYVFGLRPGGLSRRPLEQVLYELADRLGRDHGLKMTVDVDAGLAAELAQCAGELTQLAREALSNVVRHAGAASCRLSLRRAAGQGLLEIEDDGRGFLTERARGRGWGLRNMEERAASLGGRVEIDSVLDTGTAIRVLIPRDGGPPGPDARHS